MVERMSMAAASGSVPLRMAERMSMAAASGIVALPSGMELNRGGRRGGRACPEHSARPCAACSRAVWISKHQQLVGPGQWDASSLPRSESSRAGAACAASSVSSSACSFSWEAQMFAGRDPSERAHVHIQGEQKRKRIGVQVAAVREERDDSSHEKLPSMQEGEESPEAVPQRVPKRWTLEQLDQQLKVLSSQANSVPRETSGDLPNQKNPTNGRGPPLQWPNLSAEFFAYAGIGLLLLTIANNVLYKIFLGPPVVDRREVLQSSVPVIPRSRITSRDEERKAREARDQSDALAAQSREAPLPME